MSEEGLPEREVCLEDLAGCCPRPGGCPHYHTHDRPAVMAEHKAKKTRVLCGRHMAGDCPAGPRCPHIHIPRPDEDAGPAEGESVGAAARPEALPLLPARGDGPSPPGRRLVPPDVQAASQLRGKVLFSGQAMRDLRPLAAARSDSPWALDYIKVLRQKVTLDARMRALAARYEKLLCAVELAIADARPWWKPPGRPAAHLQKAPRDAAAARPRLGDSDVQVAGRLRGRVKFSGQGLEKLAGLAEARQLDESGAAAYRDALLEKSKLDAGTRALVAAYEKLLCAVRALSAAPANHAVLDGKAG